MKVNSKDLRIEFFKSSGPGGQRKNKRLTSVRITHIPTGITAVAQESRSQARNKEIALRRLREKLVRKSRRRKPRVPTRRPDAVKERILQWKKKRSLKKKMRRKKFKADDE